MRDGINLTKAGLPAVVFVWSNFERVARAQAAQLGMPDLKMFVYAGSASQPAEKEHGELAAIQIESLFLPKT